MDASDLLQRRLVPEWHGNSSSEEPFAVVFRAPSRGAMLSLSRDPLLPLMRSAKVAYDAARAAEEAGDEAARQSALASVDQAVMAAEIEASETRLRGFTRDHMVRVENLTVPAEALEWAGLPAEATVIDWVLEQPTLGAEILRAIRGAGELSISAGKG